MNMPSPSTAIAVAAPSITGLCMDIDDTGMMNTGEPLLGSDGKPYTVAGYLNGAGSVLEGTGRRHLFRRRVPTSPRKRRWTRTTSSRR